MSDSQPFKLLHSFLEVEKSTKNEQRVIPFFKNSFNTEEFTDNKRSKMRKYLETLEEIKLKNIDILNQISRNSECPNKKEEFIKKIERIITEFISEVKKHGGEESLFYIENKGMGCFENIFDLLTSEIMYLMTTGNFNLGYSKIHLENYNNEIIESRSPFKVNRIVNFLNNELNLFKNPELNSINLYQLSQGIKRRWDAYTNC